MDENTGPCLGLELPPYPKSTTAPAASAHYANTNVKDDDDGDKHGATGKPVLGQGTMNVIASAVLSGVLYFARGPYPRPLPVVGRIHGHDRGDNEEEHVAEDGGSVSSLNASLQVADREDSAPSPPPLPYLPPELYSIIASHLFLSFPPSTFTRYNHYIANDANTCLKTLLSCALASSSWLSASRPVAFHDITLTYKNVHKFLQLLRHPLCSFRNAVRGLKMREGEFMVDRWMDDALPRLIFSLGGIRTLDIYNLTWTELSPDSIGALKQGFCEERESRIESLRIGTCYFECDHEFVGFICSQSFARLKHLVCDYVLLNCGISECDCDDVEWEFWEEDGGDVDGDGESEASRNCTPLGNSSTDGIPFRTHVRPGTSMPNLPETLESLYLSLPEESMLRWFANQEAVTRLKKLGVVIREPALVGLVSKLVSRAGDTLEELMLDLPPGCSIPLNQTTSLISLRLRIPSHSLILDNPDQAYAITALAQTISTLPPFNNTIQSITFDIDTVPINGLALSSGRPPHYEPTTERYRRSEDDPLCYPWTKLMNAIDSLQSFSSFRSSPYSGVLPYITFIPRYSLPQTHSALLDLLKTECVSPRRAKIRRKCTYNPGPESCAYSPIDTFTGRVRINSVAVGYADNDRCIDEDVVKEDEDEDDEARRREGRGEVWREWIWGMEGR